VDALHSVGKLEPADRLATILHQPGQAPRRVSETPEPEPEPELDRGKRPEDEGVWRHPDPPSVDGRCGCCGWRGKVYPDRYGGHRCAVCFGLQWGWMPRG
jgi:hypothetical protein